MKLPFAALAILFAVCVWAQPDAPEGPAAARNVLKRVAETYRNLDSFEWASVVIAATKSGHVAIRPSTVLGEFRRPRQMRLEFPTPATIPRITVTDGHTAMEIYPSRRGFCRPEPKLFLEQSTPHEAMLSLAGLSRMSTSRTD